MKNNIFNNDRNSLDEIFFNAGGNEWNDAQGEGKMNGYYGADEGMQPVAQWGVLNTSRPIIISLSNTTGSAISNVALLAAFKSDGAANNGVTAGVTATYGIPSITYAQFLKMLQQSQVLIGRIEIQCSTTTQLTEALTWEVNNFYSDGTSMTLMPILDPYQQQTTLIAQNVSNLVLNGYTKLTIASLTGANGTTIRLYPSSMINAAGQLINGNIVKEFGSPVKKQTIALQS